MENKASLKRLFHEIWHCDYTEEQESKERLAEADALIGNKHEIDKHNK